MMTEGVKILKRDKQFLILKILNFLSPRLFSFTIFIGREKFTDPFFRLLNFPGKNAEVL